MQITGSAKLQNRLTSEAEAGRANDARHGRRLEYFTLFWNCTEAVVAVGAGLIAGSTALVGFGVDSMIESLSGGVLLWRLRAHVADEAREQTGLKLVGVSFLILAGYVLFEASESLLRREAPQVSVVGIMLAVTSLLVMPWLARQKRQVALRLDSRALTADSRQTDICAYLSAILLAGLLLNAVLGWWWADPVAALAMGPIIVREAVETLRGESGGQDEE